MLSPEQAQKVLEAHRVKDLLQHQRDRIQSLPDVSIMDRLHRLTIHLLNSEAEPSLSLREIAYGLIGCDRDGKPLNRNTQADYQRQTQIFQISSAALAELPPPDRLRIFEMLYPKLALQLEQFWQFIPQLPFQSGYMRKAFRAPHHPDLYLELRRLSFAQLQHVIGSYDEDLVWFAEHAAYLYHGYGADMLGKLFAAVINAGVKPATRFLTFCWRQRGANIQSERWDGMFPALC